MKNTTTKIFAIFALFWIIIWVVWSWILFFMTDNSTQIKQTQELTDEQLKNIVSSSSWISLSWNTLSWSLK